jgi:hypothetical protein
MQIIKIKYMKLDLAALIALSIFPKNYEQN